MEESINTEWPDIEVEEKFDWSLSLKEIQNRYGQSGQKVFRIRQDKKIQSRWPVDTEPYFKISTEKKIERTRQQLGWPDKPQRPIGDVIKRWEAEPEPNFHYE